LDGKWCSGQAWMLSLASELEKEAVVEIPRFAFYFIIFLCLILSRILVSAQWKHSVAE
jgi:hypothetical protein